MVKRILVFFCILSAMFEAIGFQIAENGKPACVIVTPDSPVEWENLAAKELQLYLKKITGGDFQIVKQSEKHVFPCIFVGIPPAGEGAAIEKKQGWNIISGKKSLHLFGATPTGTLYSVYELLQNYFGVYFLAPDCERISRQSNLSIPSNLKLAGEPSFIAREIYHALHSSWYPPGNRKAALYIQDWQKRNRMAPKYGSPDVYWFYSRKPGPSHNFQRYVPPEKYFASKPEMFAMDANGKRHPSNGQFCMSNPETLEAALKTLSEWIEQDRKENPDNPPMVYQFGQEDNRNYICLCPECRKLKLKHGGNDMGIVLEFANAMARKINERYPGVMLQIFAYVNTEEPCDTIKPDQHIIIWYCDLYSKSNSLLPLTHPVNKERLRILKKWAEQTKNISLWDYWNMGGGYGAMNTDCLIDSVIEDTHLFKKMGLPGVFCEDEIAGNRPQAFILLQYFIGHQLLWDTNVDPEKLIALFMREYYGEASASITEYLNMLRKAIRENPVENVRDFHNGVRKHETKAFLLSAREMLKKALQEASMNKIIATRVSRELALVDYVIYKKLRIAPDGWPFNESQILVEYKEAMRNAVQGLSSICDKGVSDAVLNSMEKELTVLDYRFRVPDFLKDKESKGMKFFGAPHMSGPSPAIVKEKDPESVMEESMVYVSDDPAKHALPFPLGFYEPTPIYKSSVAIKITEVKDEHYNWYKIGRCKVGPQSFIWLHPAWVMSISVRDVFRNADGVAENPNIFDAWISIRFTGPAYVKDSKKPNRVYIDRVIFVPPDRSK